MATLWAVLCACSVAPGLLAQPVPPAEVPPGNATLSPQELPTNLVKILRTTNKAQTNRYVPRVYTFQHVNPYAVIRFVRRVIEIEESGFFSFANPDLNGGRLLVIVPEYQVPGLDALMATIDRPELTTSAGTKRVIYRLKHRDAFDPGAANVLTSHGTSTNLVIPDSEINALFFEDAPSGVAEMERAVAIFDVPTDSLEVNVVVYEVDVTTDGQLGLDYISWKNGPGRNLFAVGLFAQKEKISTLEPGPEALIFNSGKGTFGLPGREFESTGRNAAYLYDVPSAYFDYLVVEGKARIVTQSKLVALNRNVASLTVGDQILFYNVQDAGDLRGGQRLEPLDPFGDLEGVVDTSAGGQVTDAEGALRADHPDNRTVNPSLQNRTLGSVNTGFFLQFTPIINEVGATVQMFMSLVNHTGYQDNGAPVLASHTIDTVFKIPHDGRTINIGGLVSQRRTDSANKIPFLGDIPVLGYLFGGESHLDQKSLVVATISCRTLKAQANQSPEELDLELRAKGERPTPTLENDLTD